MKSPHLKADPALTVDRSGHSADANQTWPDARGETTDPGPPPRLNPSTGLGRDEDGGRTQPDLIGPGGKLVGFGGLRPDVKVQAESAGRSAARYEANAAPARSVLPMEEDTSRRIVVNQTQPMGLPVVRTQTSPAPIAPATPATELPSDPRLVRLMDVSPPDDTSLPPDSSHAEGNDTVPRARQPKARRMWLAASVGVGIALLIALSIVFVFANDPSETPTVEAPKSSTAAPKLPGSAASVAATTEAIPSTPTSGSASLPVATSVPQTPTPPNGATDVGAAAAVKAPRTPKAGTSAAPSGSTRPTAVTPSSAVVPIEPKQAPPSSDILRSQ